MEYYNGARTHLSLHRTRLSNGLSKSSDVSAHSQSSAGSTINMLGIDLRQGQLSGTPPIATPPDWASTHFEDGLDEVAKPRDCASMLAGEVTGFDGPAK
jgi:hypothetical protein